MLDKEMHTDDPISYFAFFLPILQLGTPLTSKSICISQDICIASTKPHTD